MNARSLLLCSVLLALSGCASHDTLISWGKTAQGDPFVEAVELARGAAVTLVAGEGVCELHVYLEPGAWLITWSPSSGQDRQPHYLRAEYGAMRSPADYLTLRRLEPGTRTADLYPNGGSEGWRWEAGAGYGRPLLLRLEADGRYFTDVRGQLEAVRRAQGGLDQPR
jgi:hypothetical protein